MIGTFARRRGRLAARLVGMDLAAAERLAAEQGFSLRVVSPHADGSSRALTRDLQHGRLDVWVRGSRVETVTEPRGLVHAEPSPIDPPIVEDPPFLEFDWPRRA